MSELEPNMKSFKERAEAVLACVFCGIHHCDKITKETGRWSVNAHQLATFDFDQLTRLVVAAHDQCIRASVQCSGPRMVKIVLHERKGREGAMSQRHPTIQQAIEYLRGANYGTNEI